MTCEIIPKEEITPMMIEVYVGRQNHDNVMMIVPESNMIPSKNNKYTEKVDLIL